MEKKELQIVTPSDAPEGTVVARFATLNVVDKDGDVTLPGAFEPGAQVRISAYGHSSWTGALPVGRGVIEADDREAILRGEFFLDTDHGRNTWATLKGLGDLAEWSYGFDVLEAENGEFNGQKVRFLKRLKVYEVSPVLLGAGVDTATLAIKQAVKGAIPPHETEVVDRAWDGPSEEAQIPEDAGASVLRRMYAWVDPEGDPDVKSSYKFIHHHWDNGPGPANLRACITGIAVLNGARGGTSIPVADAQGVWDHLARHITDAGAEPPELRSRGLSFDSDIIGALAHAEAVTLRARSLAGLRAKEGRVLSGANRERLASLADALGQAADELRRFLDETDPAREKMVEQFLREIAVFEANRARILLAKH